jgi:hypothetical protein
VSAIRRAIIRVDDALLRVEDAFIALLLAVIFVIMIANVFWRYVLNEPFLWSLEILMIIFSFLVFFGASASLPHHQHMRVDALIRILPAGLRAVVGAVARRGIVLHRLIRDAVERRRAGVAGFHPRLLEYNVLDSDELERAIRLRLVDQDCRCVEIGVRAGPVDARIGRPCNSEEVRSEIVDAHSAVLCRLSFHRRRHAHPCRIRNEAFGEGDIDIAEALGGQADRVEIGLARRGCRCRRERLGGCGGRVVSRFGVGCAGNECQAAACDETGPYEVHRSSGYDVVERWNGRSTYSSGRGPETPGVVARRLSVTAHAKRRRQDDPTRAN